MTIVVDENIPRRTVAALDAMGHSVIDIRGTTDEGIADHVLWRRAHQERALFVTTDKGFVRHHCEAHFGLLAGLSAPAESTQDSCAGAASA